MASVADSMISTATRPLRLRMRPDLVARGHRYLGRSYWVVKEPLALKYFRFQEEEYAILQMLDGHASLDEIKDKFEAEFRPQKIELQDVHQFVAQLHRNGLVTSSAQGQGRSLYQRLGEVRQRELMEKLSSILALRFKGVDPQKFLNATYPLVRWLFHPLAVAMWFALAIAAGLLVLVNFEVFQSRLPSFQQFFGPHNWLLLACVLAVTKIIHELGHGYSCKHFGGECHEIGVMMLVMTPCLYCNVSDSWLLRNKWHRAAIGAAGMYIEVLMASLATFVWWFTEPGFVNHVALQVMFICSVSTILFNGNPLLRYDGYYILSDLLEIPNLRQKSSQVLQRLAAAWCLGLEMPENPFLPQRNQALFALFTMASTVYRWVVVFSIMFFLSRLFEPYGLKVIGQMMILASLIGIVVMPVVQLVRFLAVPGRLDQVKRKHVLSTLGVAGAIAGFVFLVPLPHRVRCSAEVRPGESETIYIQVPGRLAKVEASPGNRVAAGAQLVRLVNHDLDLSIAELRGRRDEQLALLDAMRAERVINPTAGGGIAAVEESLAAAQQQLDEKLRDRAKLDILAPVAGVIVEPRSRAASNRDERELTSWNGSPFDRRNTGTWLEEGTPLCDIGDLRQMEAMLVIDQGDIEFVRQGQTVWIKFDASAGRTFAGEVLEIAQVDLEDVSPGLSLQSGGTLATRTDASGAQTPLSTSYVARVVLDNSDGLLRAGMRGRAKIATRWQTVGQRIWRALHRTFRFEL